MNPSPLRPAPRVFLVDDSILIRQRMATLFGTVDGIDIVGEADERLAALAALANMARGPSVTGANHV